MEDLEEYPVFVAERLLEYGDRDALSFLFSSFSLQKIKAVLKESRRISKRSANFWAVYFDIPEEEVRCLKERFQKKQGKIWPY